MDPENQAEFFVPSPEERVFIERDAREHRNVLGRIRTFSLAGYGVLAVVVLIVFDWRAFVGLTCSALVVMINFLWLEEIVVSVLQPAPRVKAWRLFVRALARFILFGVALSVAIFVARFNTLSVLLGFSIIVIGIMGEAAYSAIFPGRSVDGNELNGTP